MQLPAALLLLPALLLMPLTQVQAQTLTGFSFGLPGVDEQALSVRQLPDGHIYLGGSTASGQLGGSDITLSKLSASGDTVRWTRHYGTASHDFGQYLNTAGPDALVMVGITYPASAGGSTADAMIIKVDTSGQEIFRKVIGLPATAETFSFVEQTSDKGFIACGFVSNTFPGGDANDAWVVKFDSLGEQQWQVFLGGWLNDYAQEVHQTADGGYIVAVDSKSFNAMGFYDCVAYKLDASGGEEWHAIAGGEPFDTGNQGVIITAAGDYIMFGEASTNLAGPGYDLTIAKVHRNGQLLWNRYLPQQGTEAAFSALETASGNLMLTGYSSANTNGIEPTDIFLLITDSAATPINYYYYGGPGADIAYDIQPSPFGGYLIAGATQDSGSFDYQLLMFGYTPPLQQPPLVSASPQLHLYPNPARANRQLQLELPHGPCTWELNDMLGRTYSSGSGPGGRMTIQLPASAADGLYVVQVKQAGGRFCRKVLLTR